MKIKLQILSWLTKAVLFEYECENNTIKKTVEKAVKNRANLYRASLYEANLNRANLNRANLDGANLNGANLNGASLNEASLYEANLDGANLYGASLNGASLNGASLNGANGLDIWWHVHHEILWEILTEPVKYRINYIKKDKSKNEIELRLKLLKPVLGEIPKDKKGWERLHKKECGCGWDGQTILTKKNGFIKKL